MPDPQLRKIERDLKRTAERGVKNVARQVHTELTAGTPVRSSNLKNNWIPSVRFPAGGRVPVGKIGARTGAAATAGGLARLATYQLEDGPAIISNRVGYAGDNLIDDRPGFIEGAIRRGVLKAEVLG